MAKSLRQLEEELQDLVDEAQAIQNVADADQGGTFTQDQQNRWDELMRDSDDDDGMGLISAKQIEVEQARKIDTQKRQLVNMRRTMLEPSQRYAESPNASKPRVISRLGRLKAFRGDQPEQDAYDCGMWMRALISRARHEVDDRAEQRIASRGWSIRSTHTEGDPTKGGYTVPDPLAAAIINYRELSGISRQICRVIPMTADTLSIPKKTGTTTVYYPGEATSITESEQTFGQVQLTAKKRAVLSKVSQELSDDAIINVVDDLAMEIGSDLAIQEDKELVKGDGTGTYGGVTGLLSALGAGGKQSAAANHDTWPELDFADFSAAMGKLPAKFRAMEPAWLVSPTFYDTVMVSLMAANGLNAIQAWEAGAQGAGRGVGMAGRFLGYPVYFTDQMPSSTAVNTVCALFGSFRAAAMIGDRMGIRVALSPDYAFNEDVITIRATSRYDIVVHEPGGASAAGAYVGLSTST